MCFCVMTSAQYDAMTDELNRRREECIQLRTLLASRSSRRGSAGGGEGAGVDSGVPLNEDGELEMAYKTQKDLNKYVNPVTMPSTCAVPR